MAPRFHSRGALRKLGEKAISMLRRTDGPLTRELARELGGFGLGQVPTRLVPDATTTAVCGFCATGCGLNLHLKDGEAINLSPATDYPVNLGMACPKGWKALAPLDAGNRATDPLLRDEDGRMRAVDWDRALREFVARFRGVKDHHGDNAMAFLSTGQIPTEEMVALGTLAKFGMGMIHGDGNTRQCMATAASAYKESFGFDAPPYSYQDFEESDVIVLVGSNLCISHPILWQRICRNRNEPRILVLDPRRTETAMAGTDHFALAPASDLILLQGVARVLIENDQIDRDYIAAHTEGYASWAEHVASFTEEGVSEATGLSIEAIQSLARTIARGERVSFWWTMGVNQGHQAVRTAQSIINLALMTGNLGRPGTGANSITGQCNAMGSRLFSNTTSLLGGRSFENPLDRMTVARRLGIDVTRIPNEPSLAYDEIIDRIHTGEIRALWIVATNAAHSWIHRQRFLEAVEKLDFLVVQDIHPDTETARLADLFLPAAAWGEKEGTFINSERRIGLLKKVRRAPGRALADFHIFRLIAEYWGCADLFASWKTTEDVFDDIKRLSRDLPCDISGIESYRELDRAGGIQWPYPEGIDPPARERRLFEDGRFHHANGRARFCFGEARSLPEPVDREFPLALLTGRASSSQWHTETRTGNSAVLRKLQRDELYVEIHPRDAQRLHIQAEEIVRVRSRRGAIDAVAVVTPTVRPGQVFIPMHWSAVNDLTQPVFDPISHQPAYKHCAVRIEKATTLDR